MNNRLLMPTRHGVPTAYLPAMLILQSQVEVTQQPQEGGCEAGQLPGITLQGRRGRRTNIILCA